jgi:hypothetical protein
MDPRPPEREFLQERFAQVTQDLELVVNSFRGFASRNKILASAKVRLAACLELVEAIRLNLARCSLACEIMGRESSSVK